MCEILSDIPLFRNITWHLEEKRKIKRKGDRTVMLLCTWGEPHTAGCNLNCPISLSHRGKPLQCIKVFKSFRKYEDILLLNHFIILQKQYSHVHFFAYQILFFTSGDWQNNIDWVSGIIWLVWKRTVNNTQDDLLLSHIKESNKGLLWLTCMVYWKQANVFP